MALDYFRLDERVGPQSLKQFVLRDQSSGVLNQISQDAECLRCQANPIIVSIVPVTPETLIDRIQPERRKFLHAWPAMLRRSLLPPYDTYNHLGAVVSQGK